MILHFDEHDSIKLSDRLKGKEDSKYTHVSVEIWQLICRDLHPKDIYNLMKCSKRLYHILRSDLVWKNRVINRWYGPIYTIMGGPKDKIPVDNFFLAHEKLSKNDRNIDVIVQSISRMQTSLINQYDKESLISCIEEVIGQKPEMMIPELLDLRHHLTFKSFTSGLEFMSIRRNALKYRLEHMRQVFVASALLEAIQCKIVLDLLSDLYYFEQIPESIEWSLLQFSAIDPHFFELCLARHHVREKVLQRLRNIYGPFEKSTFDVIQTIITTFQSILREIRGTNNILDSHTGEKQYFEDALMDRAYNNRGMPNEEDIGSLHSIPNYIAIIKSLCDELKIKLRINSMLIECRNMKGKTIGVIPLDPVVPIDVNNLPEGVANFQTDNKSYCTYAIESLLGIDQSRGIRHSILSSNEDIIATKAIHNATIYNEFVRNSLCNFINLYIQTLEHQLDPKFTQELVQCAASHRHPALLIMLKIQMKRFKDSPWYPQVIEDIDRKLLEVESFYFSEERESSHDYSDERARICKKSSMLDVGEIVFTNRGEAVIITAVGYPVTYFCLTAANYLVIFSEHELQRKCFKDEVVYQFADYDDLGAFFKRFDWETRRFVRK